jgi:hypothetical protein
VIDTHRTFHLPVRLLSQYILFVIFLLGCQGVVRVEAIETLDKLPSQKQALEMSVTRYSAEKPSVVTNPLDVALEVRRNYDLILARREQLQVSVEVKGHFEKAVKQAEKKFESGDEDISSSSITKLKLGLAGTLNDISGFNSDIALAQLRLEKYMGVQWAQKVDISGPKFQPEDFPHKTVDEFLNNNASGSKTPNETSLFDLREAMIEINKVREQRTLAAKNRRMTRALLVTEAANYDFGIGNEADLFEALIIYTRVLVGHYEAIHSFNVAVHRFYSLYQAK